MYRERERILRITFKVLPVNFNKESFVFLKGIAKKIVEILLTVATLG